MQKRRYEICAAVVLLAVLGGVAGFLLNRNSLDQQLVAAVGRGDTVAVQTLLSQGASPNARERFYGLPVLAVAADQGSAEILRVLLGRGAKVNATALKGGDTALTQAASHGDPVCVQLLLNNGAAVNMRNGAGMTPLMNAAWQGHAQSVEILLKAGADTRPKGMLGTALKLAMRGANLTDRHQERITLVRLLQNAGAPE